MTYDNFRAIGDNDAAQGLSDLFNVSLQGDDTEDFHPRLDQTLLAAGEISKENILEGFEHVEDARFCSASDCVSNVRHGN